MSLLLRSTPTRPTARHSEDAARRSRLVGGQFPLRYLLIVLGSVALRIATDVATLPWDRSWMAVRGVTECSTGALGLALLLTGALDLAPPRWLPQIHWKARLVVVAGAVVMTIDTLLVLAALLVLVLLRPASVAYYNDVIAFTHVNADLVLDGQNPYTTDSGFAASLTRFPGAGATPLRRGVFGTGYDYPQPAALLAAEARYLARPGAPDGSFDPRTLHSYPALSFLLYVPLVWAGVPDILILHVLVYAGLFLWLVRTAPRGVRRFTALVLGAAVSLVGQSLPMDTEIVCAGFLLLAWHWRDRRWVSALLWGLGCAFKQYCWLFAPYFVVDAWRTCGWREALRRVVIAALAFLLPNLPYLLASPRAWWTSLFLPMSEPLFPMGIGIVAPAIGGLLPFAAPVVYTGLEALALAGCLWAFARWHSVLGEAALLLALIPFFFAFRSPANYFAIAPWFALSAANRIYARRLQSTERTSTGDGADAPPSTASSSTALVSEGAL